MYKNAYLQCINNSWTKITKERKRGGAIWWRLKTTLMVAHSTPKLHQDLCTSSRLLLFPSTSHLSSCLSCNKQHKVTYSYAALGTKEGGKTKEPQTMISLKHISDMIYILPATISPCTFP